MREQNVTKTKQKLIKYMFDTQLQSNSALFIST